MKGGTKSKPSWFDPVTRKGEKQNFPIRFLMGIVAATKKSE
jgi:hypothetical protein